MYSASVDGQPTTFGTSGLLYRSNKLMYDRTTQSLWASFLGEPVIGPLADSGASLPRFPVALTTWEEWRTEHPDTSVLSIHTGIYPPEAYRHEADPQSAYFDYRASRGTMFPVPIRDERLGTKEEILGLSNEGSHKAYPLSLLRERRVVNDVVGGLPVVIAASPNSSAARVYARGDRSFEPDSREGTLPAAPSRLVDRSGAVWQIEEDALTSSADPAEELPRVPASVSFWFAWLAFHPDTEVYGAE